MVVSGVRGTPKKSALCSGDTSMLHPTKIRMTETVLIEAVAKVLSAEEAILDQACEMINQGCLFGI
jgi:hypothetical protein